MKQVTMYSSPTCHFCHMAKDFLDEKHVKYTDYNVRDDYAKLQEMMVISEQMATPTIVIKDGDKEDIIVGFNKHAIEQALA